MSIARKIGNLGTALDSAALSTFLSKGTTDGEFDTIAWDDVTGKPSYIDSSLATQLFDSAYVQARQSAVSSGGLDSAAVTSLIDSNYVAARATAASSSGFVMYNYNATSGQTAFQDSDTAGNVLSYTADGILVYYNGLLLADEDYTATDGAAVTLTEGADSGAQITIGKWNLTGSGSGSAGGAVWYGDRGLLSGGATITDTSGQNVIQYIDITSPGNATDFGDLISAAEPAAATSDGTYGVVSDENTDLNYITIATLGNATDFGGNLIAYRAAMATASDGTYGLFASGDNSPTYDIDYITFASPGNATGFGNLTVDDKRAIHGAVSDGTYGLFGGGWNGTIRLDGIDYVTIASPGNATNFGDLSVANSSNAGVSDTTYGLFGGGYDGTRLNAIDYVTIASPGNATDFGDLTVSRSSHTTCSNNTYAVFCGGFDGARLNVIDYVTIASPGNATDFGDMLEGVNGLGGTSGSPS